MYMYNIIVHFLVIIKKLKKKLNSWNILYLVIVVFSMCSVMKLYQIINEDFFNMKYAVVTWCSHMLGICHFQGQPEKLSYKSSSGGTTPSSERKHELGSSTELQVDSADEVKNNACVYVCVCVCVTEGEDIKCWYF